jgi:2-polyprenyl-3-methyl-5-hydroxy-6-metoxy-1,4-benzoquinol methylase
MKEMFKHYESYFLKLNLTTKESFDDVSKFYSFVYGKYLPVDKNAHILDLGCGIGHFLYFLKNMGYSNFFGVDFSKGQIDFVEKNITKKVAVAEALAFLREVKTPYKLIVINDVLEYVKKENLMEFLHLTLSSLEPGGSVFIKVPNMSNPFGLRSRYIDILHEIGFTEHSLLEVLESTDFSDIKIIGSSSPVVSFKSFILKLGRISIHKILKLMFLVQGYAPPKILDPLLIAIAKRQ